MAKTIKATSAQVNAAKILVKQGQASGSGVSSAVRAIAAARPSNGSSTVASTPPRNTPVSRSK